MFKRIRRKAHELKVRFFYRFAHFVGWYDGRLKRRCEEIRELSDSAEEIQEADKLEAIVDALSEVHKNQLRIKAKKWKICFEDTGD